MISRCLWILCWTLFFVVIQADAWFPAGILKFKRGVTRRAMTNKDESESDAEQRRLSLLPWWEDSWSEAWSASFLNAPSFVGGLTNSSSTTATTEAAEEWTQFQRPTTNPSAEVLHFCFLLHGHRGFSTDLSYLQRVMQHDAELEKRDNNNNNNNHQQDMIVHCAVCNEGKTTDGVVNGGERLVLEILQSIREELRKRQTFATDNSNNIQDITISIVGNSLGGIYGRYAIARLAQKAVDSDSNPELSSCSPPNSKDTLSCVLLDGKYRLHFNIFCTTASPHLGISKHTYVPLPRSVEMGAAIVLGETGKDLFRLNDLMKTMATCPTFLEPLRKFRKRVAYANAYATDFPVPTNTAAFLSDQSTYPHHFAEGNTTTTTATATNDSMGEEPHQGEDEKRRHVVATLHTPAASSPPEVPEEEAIVDDLVQMSNSLDSLGWKKVFVDVRKEIPLRVALPRSVNIRKSIEKGKKSIERGKNRLKRQISQTIGPSSSDSSTWADLLTTALEEPSGGNGGYESDESSKQEPSAIHRLREQGIVESRDVASLVSTPDDMRLSFPLGHNLMVALDRSGISGGLYKGGRPVMDSLAEELVHDIFEWNLQDENNAAQKTLRMTEKVEVT